MSSIATNNALSTLFTGANASAPSVYDLVSGSKQDLTTSVLSGLAKQSPILNESQTNNFSALETFIKDNLSEGDASKLLTSLNALKTLTQTGNNTRAALDPVFSLLANNPDITKAISTGSIVNQVA